MKEILVYGLKNMHGGLEKYLLSMHEQIHEDVRFVYLVEQCDCIHWEQIRRLGGEIIYLPAKHPVKENLNALERVLEERYTSIDTFYVNVNSITFDIAVILMGLRKKYRVIVHSHNAGMEHIRHPMYRALHKTLEFFSLRMMKGFGITRLAVSDRAAGYLFPGSRYYLIVPGVDAKQFAFNAEERRQLRKSLGYDSQYVYGFVGRLEDVKNPGFLLKVFQKITQKREEDCRLLLVGDGSLRQELEQQARDLGIFDKVCFAGQQKNPSAFYQAMDYMMLPSQSEGLSLVAIEAQACGLPIACSAGRFPGTITLTPLVNFVPLEDGEAAWADACIAHAKQFADGNRGQWNQIILDSCFEIKNAAESLKQMLCDGPDATQEREAVR